MTNQTPTPTDPLLAVLERIACALESLASAQGAPYAPNLVRPLGDYQAFDWSTIGAEIVDADADGPTHISFGGQIWTRRSPINKFEPAIWFSRPTGKDADGNTSYVRLVTFREIKAADSLNPKARRDAPAPAQRPPAPATTPERVAVASPTDAGEAAPAGPRDWTGYWSRTVPALGVDKVRAADVLKSAGNDAVRAYRALIGE